MKEKFERSNNKKLNNLKPLDDYLQELKSRNCKFGSAIPPLQNTVENISSYDDLYKKLIEESYYICNELLNKKFMLNTSKPTRNTYIDGLKQEKDELPSFSNINRALIFQSSENMNNLNLKSDRSRPQSELLSAINNDVVSVSVDDFKSYLYSATGKKNTGVKSFLNGNNTNNKKENALSSSRNNINNPNDQDIRDIKNINKDNQHNNSKMIQNHPPDDLIYLLNNAIEVEKVLEREDPITKIEFLENRINRNLAKLEEIDNQEIHFIQEKDEIEKKTTELNSLFKLYEDKFIKIEEYLNLLENEKLQVSTRENEVKPVIHNTNHNINTNHELIIENRDNNDCNPNDISNKSLKTKFSLSNNSDNKFKNISNTYNRLENQINQKEICKEINVLLSNSKIKEASDIWRRFNYEKLEGVSLERSYEMLIYITRLKDKEIDLLSRKISLFEEKSNDSKRKDAEIIELFAELEIYKSKMKHLDQLKLDIKNFEIKNKNLLKENQILLKENIKINTIIEQNKYLDQRFSENF